MPQNQVIAVTSRQLYSDPLNVIKRICGFLGVTAPDDVDPINIHEGNYVGEKLDLQVKERYLSHFSRDIQDTGALTGLDLSSWLNPSYDESTSKI